MRIITLVFADVCVCVCAGFVWVDCCVAQYSACCYRLPGNCQKVAVFCPVRMYMIGVRASEK